MKLGSSDLHTVFRLSLPCNYPSPLRPYPLGTWILKKQVTSLVDDPHEASSLLSLLSYIATTLVLLEAHRRTRTASLGRRGFPRVFSCFKPALTIR
ncbi:uncharacterized protein BDW70DRAFT_89380 [Aspergillus foveolatus]|uniref:uncharacterized protein n=1 Tax=Aspergillus foveolatus TaxID=210207 RepID=UPI003CCD9B4A